MDKKPMTKAEAFRALAEKFPDAPLFRFLKKREEEGEK